MNIQSKLPTAPDEFLRWNEGREGKREAVMIGCLDLRLSLVDLYDGVAVRLRP